MSPWEEHLDHMMGSASEQENALAWSRMNRRPDDSGKIDAEVSKGNFVVVLDGPEYCPSTDALMGSRKVLHSTHKSREAASLVLNGLGDMDEVQAYILPRPVVKPLSVEARQIMDDEIPF
jgi:hypothetical protein